MANAVDKLGRAARALAGVLLLTACDQQPPQPAAVFDAPSALVMAGSEPLASCVADNPDADDINTVCPSDRLFIANLGEDSLHVMEVGASFFSFVRSPAQYFNLRIPAGPNPAALAATPNGRYVLILNGVIDALRIVDADSLELVRCGAGDGGCESGDVYRHLLGGSGSLPSHLVGTTEPCPNGDCLMRVYVALAGEGTILELDLIEGPNGPRFVDRRVLSVGGAPRRLALSPDETYLFATDFELPDVIRVDLASGAADRTPLGGLGEDLALSQDGTLLLVARPADLDVQVFADPTTVAFAPLDADPAFAGVPTCINTCDEAPVCEPAGAAIDLVAAHAPLCATDRADPPVPGLATPAGMVPYGGVFLGEVPVRLVTLSDSVRADQRLRNLPCGTTPTDEWSQWAMVVTLDGLHDFITLRKTTGEFQVGLVDGLCQGATLTDTDANDGVDAEDILSPCPSVPDRNRFACAGGHVITFPGITGRAAGTAPELRFDWEGVLVPRSSGGGEVLEGGVFADPGTNFFNEGVQAGDLLQILTQPSGDPTCVAETGESPELCTLERTIVADPTDDDPNRLVLDEPLPEVCFTPGSVAYNIRAGGQFLVRLNGNRTVRVGVGERVGPGGTRAPEAALMFQISPDLDPRLDEPACDRYDAVTGLVSPLVRDPDVLPAFDVDDGFLRVQSGFDPDVIDLPVGRLPSSALVARMGERTAIFVSYSGSLTDRVVVVRPEVPQTGAALFDLATRGGDNLVVIR